VYSFKAIIKGISQAASALSSSSSSRETTIIPSLVAVSPKLLGIHDTAGATVVVVRARARTVVPSPCACEDAAEPLITAAAATSESEAKAFPISSEIFSKMLFRGRERNGSSS
jgi:hypothetical protein